MERPEAFSDDVMLDTMPFGYPVITRELAKSIEELFEEEAYCCDFHVYSDVLSIMFYDKGFEISIKPDSRDHFVINITCGFDHEDEDEDEILDCITIRRNFVIALGYKESPYSKSGYALEKRIHFLEKKRLLQELSIAGRLIHNGSDSLLPLRKCGLPIDPDQLN